MPFPANDINRVNAVINEFKGIANDWRSLTARIDAAIQLNAATGVDWGNATKPAILVEDSAGNLNGYSFTRGDLANLIDTLVQFQNMNNNQAVAQTQHLNRINYVADAAVRYPI